tara:strand:+ start:460 stop:660 length:201 start_codon:yes stop_codon:yes gene_type:complete
MGDINAEKWKTVKLPKGLSERIDEFVSSKDAYRLGLTSNSQVVAHAIRQFLESKGSVKFAEHEPIQ